jgi:flavin-dependent dehydrogenase
MAPDAWSSHPIRWFSHDVPIARPNVILVGDAAGIEPAFGGGIHLALSYGEIAAKALIQAFQTDDFSFRHYNDGLMSHYLGKHIRRLHPSGEQGIQRQRGSIEAYT